MITLELREAVVTFKVTLVPSIYMSHLSPDLMLSKIRI
jgi:hypothetical protein